jgi:hypothetical protein
VHPERFLARMLASRFCPARKIFPKRCKECGGKERIKEAAN